LNQARESSDAEVSERARTLIRTIEEIRDTELPAVVLDFEDRPIAEVVAALAKRTGAAVALTPEAYQACGQKRVTLTAERPLPFWEALDRLCRAAQVAPWPSEVQSVNRQGGNEVPAPARVRFDPNNPDPQAAFAPLQLTCEKPVLFPTSYHGSFAVRLTRLQDVHYRQVDASLEEGAPASKPMVSDQFRIQMSIRGRPGAQVIATAPPRIEEALDDQGRSLIPTPSDLQAGNRGAAFDPNVGRLQRGRMAGQVGGNFGTGIVLKRPDPSARAIRRLRGIQSLRLVVRKDPPLVVLLDPIRTGPRTVTFQGVSATFASFKVNPDAPSAVLTVDFEAIQPAAAGAPLQPNMAGQIGNPAQAVRALDFDAPSTLTNGTNVGGPANRLRQEWTFLGRLPTEVRIPEVIERAFDLPFEFRDIPLPQETEPARADDNADPARP
jgi:hypothetical protein